MISSVKDVASSNMARYIVKEYGFSETEIKVDHVKEAFSIGNLSLFIIDTESWKFTGADELRVNLAIFLSKHKSAKGIPALTTHSLGNWNDRNELGGKPHMLSASAPEQMLMMLRRLNGIDADMEKVYEATHHGPLLNVPSFFAELGGSDDIINNNELAERVGSAAYETALDIADGKTDSEKIVIGIGSNHYPEKFSKLAKEKGYAFSYMFPKYAMFNQDGSGNFHMISQAIEKTKDLDLAVIEWKSLNVAARNEVLKSLNDAGVDHEKV